jgi:hypothetical protein
LPNQRPGDFLRDQWIAAVREPLRARGWMFERIPSTVVVRRIGHPDVGLLRDNNAFRISQESASPEDSEGGVRLPATRAVSGLLHASDHSESWGVSSEHLFGLGHHSAETGESCVMVLLDGAFDDGFIVPHAAFPWQRARVSATVILDVRDANRGVHFDSADSCANLLSRPETLQPRPAIPPPPKRGICSAHGMMFRRESGRWVCPRGCVGSYGVAGV